MQGKVEKKENVCVKRSIFTYKKLGESIWSPLYCGGKSCEKCLVEMSDS